MTWFAATRHLRSLWIAGAVGIGLVILKLFSIDLLETGTLARITSFFSVGLLLLAIGYLAPMPDSKPTLA